MSRMAHHARLGYMNSTELESSYVPDHGAPDHLIGVMFLRAPGTLQVRNAPVAGQSVTFRVEKVGETFVPTSVAVSSERAEEITSTDLRAVNVKGLWRAAIIRYVDYYRAQENGLGQAVGRPAKSPIQLPDDQLEKMRLRGPERETLEYVGDLYALAAALGLAPALYVQQAFAGEGLEPLPRSTATKWIKRARDLDLIHEGGSNGDD